MKSEFYDDPYGSYDPYANGDGSGWDPYAGILHKSNDKKTVKESQPEEQIGPVETKTEKQAEEQEKTDEKQAVEEEHTEQTEKQTAEREEPSAVNKKKQEEQPVAPKKEKRPPQKKKRKRKRLTIVVLILAAWLAYRAGYNQESHIQTARNVPMSAEENLSVEASETEAAAEEETTDTEVEETAAEEAVQPEENPEQQTAETTEELFEITIEQEYEEGQNVNAETVYTASLLDNYSGLLDSSKKIGIISAEATSTIVQEKTTNEPMRMFDGQIDTSWQEGVDGPGLGENFTAYFSEPVKVKYITFRLGNWKSNEYYYGNNRPRTLDIELGNMNTQIEFPDVWQEFCVEITPPCEASSMRVVLNDVYAGTSWDDTAITDINLYRE